MPVSGVRFGRYRLIEELGSGGMAVVHRAMIDGPKGFTGECVIKRILPALAGDPVFVAALAAEARVCARLHHPSIVQVHELGEVDGELFLAMEYVEGVTLGRILRRAAERGRPIEPGLACFIAATLAEALHYAHTLVDDDGRALEIVHRDLTPANVMVTRTGQVKLLDFGIAAAAGSLRSDTTRTGMVKGTPDYMSPEQADGRRVDPRSDLFSLGIILHECLTGRRLFRGVDDLDTLRLVRAAAVPPPSSSRSAISADIDAAVAPLLARDPADRYPNGEAAAQRLRPIAHRDSADAAMLQRLVAELGPFERSAATPAASPRTAPHRRPQKRRTRVVPMAIAFVLPLAAIGWLTFRHHSSRPATVAHAAAPHSARRTIAVLGFRNLNGRADAAWISTALAEMLRSELGAGGVLHALSTDEVARVKTELSIPDADTLAAGTLARIRSDLDSDLVLLGSYTLLGAGDAQRLRLDLRVQNSASGDTACLVSETGNVTELFDLVEHAGRTLREKLGVSAASARDERSARTSLPRDLQAARSYAEGLERLHAGDALAARARIERAIALAPDYAPAHQALAQAWQALGYDRNAQSEAGRALALATELPREQRVSIEGYYEEAMHAWQRAADAYQTLVDFFPDDVDYRIDLARVQRRGGHPRDALAVLDACARLPPPARDDPRIGIARAEALLALGENQQQIAVATAAADEARARGATLLMAEAERMAAGGYERVQQCGKAIPLARAARDTFAAAGARRQQMRAANAIASCLADEGDLVGALRLHEENLGIAHAIGDRLDEGMAQANAALALKDLGRLDEARQRLQSALALQREIDDRRDVACDLGNLASVLDQLGDLPAARVRAAEAVEMARSAGDQNYLAVLQGIRGELALNAGQLAAAERDLEAEQELATRIGNRTAALAAKSALAELLWRQDRAGEARRMAEAVLRAQTALASSQDVIEALLLLASVDEAERRYPDEEKHARQALAALTSRDPPRVGAAANLALARALLAEGNTDEAASQLGRARAADGSQLPFQLQMAIEIVAARLDASAGRSDAGRKRLAGAADKLARAGYVADALDARVQLGELEKRARVAGAEARLRKLAGDAHAFGLEWVVARAGALSR